VIFWADFGGFYFFTPVVFLRLKNNHTRKGVDIETGCANLNWQIDIGLLITPKG
jgi:hypothetical protein